MLLKSQGNCVPGRKNFRLVEDTIGVPFSQPATYLT